MSTYDKTAHLKQRLAGCALPAPVFQAACEALEKWAYDQRAFPYTLVGGPADGKVLHLHPMKLGSTLIVPLPAVTQVNYWGPERRAVYMYAGDVGKLEFHRVEIHDWHEE